MAFGFMPVFTTYTGGGSPPAPGYSYTNTEASTLVGQMTTTPDDTRKGVIDDFFTRVKLQSTWDVMDAFWMLAAADSQAARLDWHDPAAGFTLTESGSVSFTADAGYTKGSTNSSSHLATGWNALDDGVNFTQDDASLGVWYSGVGGQTFNFYGVDANGYKNVISGNGYRVNGGGGNNGSEAAYALDGLHSAQRTGANSTERFHNAVSVDTGAITSVAPQNTEFFITGANSGSGASPFGSTDPTFSAAFAGGSLTSDQNWVLYEAIRRYLYDVGALTFEDDFNRADETLESSDNWTLLAGSAGDGDVVSNEAVVVGQSGSLVYYTYDLGVTEGFVETDLDAHPDANTMPLLFNCGGTNDGIEVRAITLGRYRLIADGTSIGLSSDISSSYPCTLRVEVLDSQARILADGVEVIGWTSYTPSTGTNVGFGSRVDAATLTIDNFRAGAVQVFTDDFNRADENLEDSDDWTLLEGDAGDVRVENNKLSVVWRDFFAACPISAVDAYAQLTIENATDQTGFALAIRGAAGGNCVALRYTGTTGTDRFQIYKRVNGSTTLLYNAGTGLSVGAGDVLRLEAVGDTVTLRHNGERVTDVTLGGDLASNTGVGISNFSPGLQQNTESFDNFEAGTL